MFTAFRQEKAVILLDPDIDISVDPSVGVDVILSPALYWVRRFSLPIRSSKEALKLLPSLFEEFLPEGEFRYYGYFDGDEFVGFAYEEDALRTLLQQKGIALGMVGGIYFAQNELQEEMLPLRIEGGHVLQKADGVVLKLPDTFVSDAKEGLKTPIELSAHKIMLERFGGLVDRRTLYRLGALLLAVTILYGMEWAKSYEETKRVQQLEADLFSSRHLLPTTLQNEALMKRFERIDASQKQIRRFIATVMHAPLSSGEYLESMRIGKKHAVVVFANVASPKPLLHHFRGFKMLKTEHKGRRIVMEVAL